MRVGITCYPTYGGSGVVATELGLELAARGHDVHFISYAMPVRITEAFGRVHFHEVEIRRIGRLVRKHSETNIDWRRPANGNRDQPMDGLSEPPIRDATTWCQQTLKAPIGCVGVGLHRDIA